VDVALDAFVAGGYFVVRPCDREPWMPADLLPPRVLSVSSCICTFFPDAWSLSWTSDSAEKRSAAAAAFGIPEARLPELVAWATASFNRAFGWPRVLYSLEDARAARALLGADREETVLFGIGLAVDLAPDFFRLVSPRAQEPGHDSDGDSGFAQCVGRGRALAAGGRPLGYEPLVTDIGQVTHSWLCNGLAEELRSTMGAVPNAHGFIDDPTVARRFADHINSGGVGAEPGLWLPWLVVEYD
jgi:hypothetical protein